MDARKPTSTVQLVTWITMIHLKNQISWKLGMRTNPYYPSDVTIAANGMKFVTVAQDAVALMTAASIGKQSQTWILVCRKAS